MWEPAFRKGRYDSIQHVIMIHHINTNTFKWRRLVFTLFGSICSFLLQAQDTIHLHTYVGNLKKLPVTLGDSTYTFLFDSGGGESFIAPGIIRHLNKTIYGLSIGFRMHGDIIHYQKCDSLTLNIGGISIFHLPSYDRCMGYHECSTQRAPPGRRNHFIKIISIQNHFDRFKT